MTYVDNMTYATMSRIFVDGARNADIYLDVLVCSVTSQLRETFRTFYIANFCPRPINPV